MAGPVGVAAVDATNRVLVGLGAPRLSQARAPAGACRDARRGPVRRGG